jgi:hypothetical protein
VNTCKAFLFVAERRIKWIERSLDRLQGRNMRGRHLGVMVEFFGEGGHYSGLHLFVHRINRFFRGFRGREKSVGEFGPCRHLRFGDF